MSIAPEAPAKRTFPTHLDLPFTEEQFGKPLQVPFPTHLDLPHTDDQPVENSYQPAQSEILRQSLVPFLRTLHPGGDFFLGFDTAIYFRTTEPPEKGCRAPDFFYVPGVPARLGGELRRSYVLWVETVAPLLVVEYVSGNGLEERDKTPFTGKFWIYEQAIRAPYYAIWDWRKDLLEVFVQNGTGYKRLEPGANGRFAIPAMGIELGK